MQRENDLAKAADRARIAQAKLAKINEQGQKAAAMQDTLKGAAVSSSSSLSYAAAAVTGTFAAPVREAMAMEDAMAEVNKVANFDTPEGLKNLQDDLEKMSTRIPMSADALAQIAAAAGQSGIATKDLASFTEQAAKMGVAFDITADEAGTMMAKWQSGMGLTLDKTYKLADATNFLSNCNAAQAKQIGDVLQRYGALGKVAGLTETQTAAFAASVLASSAEAETAATGIKAFMRAMGKGGSMSEVQAAAFGNAGLDPKTLQKDLQKDAPKVIIETLEAIKKKIPKEQWNQYLSVMFGEEAAVAVGPMMQNLEGLKKNFSMVADEANYAGSMLAEFEVRSATTSNALIIAKNSAVFAARALGAPLLDPLKESAREFVRVALEIGKWIKENKELVFSSMKAAAAIAAFVGGFHALRIAVFLVASPIISLCKGILNLQKAVILAKNSILLKTVATKAWMVACSIVTATIKGLTASVKLLGSALKLMFTNPVGLAILAVAGLVAAGVILYKNWDVVKAKLVELWTIFSEKFPGIAQVVKNWAANVGTIIENVKCIFSGIMDFVKKVFVANWSTAWESVKSAFSNAFGALVGIAKAPLNAIIGMVNSVISGINSIGSVKMPEWAGGKSFGISIPSIPQLASGGVATQPTLAMIGEGRESEAVLPLSKLDGLLGAHAGGGAVSISFSPVINVTSSRGDAYADVKRGLEEGSRNLKKEIERLMNNQRRVSFV